MEWCSVVIKSDTINRWGASVKSELLDVATNGALTCLFKRAGQVPGKIAARDHGGKKKNGKRGP